mmetsp:Transcript_3110/g.10308  ORF Transcript_3110/g.10308 Transcript_3110/m.10308 type:complete len:253 (-) Transcript_3110:1092-1850(-)
MRLFDRVKPYLYYRTARHVRVDIWQVGLTNRILQTGIMIAFIATVIASNSWAASERPLGVVNAWEDGGRYGFAPTLNRSSEYYSYCASPDHNYSYSSNFEYISPECRTLQPEEIVTKGIGSISFTTSIIETYEYSWECGNQSAATRAKEASCGGAVVDRTNAGRQCSCATSQTYYVKGVEELQVAFEHSYFTSGSSRIDLSGVSNHKSCADTQGDKTCAKHPLSTAITYPNGTERTFQAAGDRLMRLRDHSD